MIIGSHSGVKLNKKWSLGRNMKKKDFPPNLNPQPKFYLQKPHVLSPAPLPSAIYTVFEVTSSYHKSKSS